MKRLLGRQNSQRLHPGFVPLRALLPVASEDGNEDQKDDSDQRGSTRQRYDDHQIMSEVRRRSRSGRVDVREGAEGHRTVHDDEQVGDATAGRNAIIPGRDGQHELERVRLDERHVDRYIARVRIDRERSSVATVFQLIRDLGVVVEVEVVCSGLGYHETTWYLVRDVHRVVGVRRELEHRDVVVSVLDVDRQTRRSCFDRTLLK